MKNQSLELKKLIVPIGIAALLIIAIIVVLAINKKKINEASTPIDRTQIPVSVSVAESVYKQINVNTEYPAVTKPYEEANVYAQSSGIITDLNISLGQQVTKDEILGTLDTRIIKSNLKAAAISLESAQINRKKLLDDYNRAKDLFENNAGLEVNMLNAKNNYENALAAEDNARVQLQLMNEQLANTNIIAPVSGIISTNNIKEGEYVSPATPIASISNVSSIKVTVYVDQALSYQLKYNQTADITSPVFGKDKFSGKIIYISPIADNNHNYQVDLLVVNNSSAKLKGGTDVKVSFNNLSKSKALVIPKSALCLDKEFPYVYVADNNKAIARNIEVGIIKNDEVEVLSSLVAGEKIITRGQINLTDGSNINIIK